jgi:hypothetical protein
MKKTTNSDQDYPVMRVPKASNLRKRAGNRKAVRYEMDFDY